jgi:membrane-associated protease RseP (regulator of RpoE activity)
VPDLWPWLLLLLVPAAVRAAGRYLAARRLGARPSVRIGFGPAILQRTTDAGVAWKVGIVPVPLVRVEAIEVEGPGALPRRAAMVLSGPVAVYVAAAALVAGTVGVRGEEHETNLVEELYETGPAARVGPGGLRAGDRIVAVDHHPTPDGRSLRRFLTWVDGDDGEVRVTFIHDGEPREITVQTQSDARFLFLVPVAPELGVVLRVERERVGVLAALGRGLAFPVAPGSAIRWLGEAIVPRVELHLRDYPVTYVPSLRRRSWPFELADLMGLFAILSVLPWPGLDGGELFVVACRALRGGRLAPWFEGLLRSPGWGAAMAFVVALASLFGSRYLTDAAFGVHSPPAGYEGLWRALFTWAG